MTGSAKRKKTTYDTSSPSVNFYIGGTLREGNTYTNRIYVTWFDNERYVTKEVSTCSDSGPCSITASAKPYILFDDTPYEENESIPTGITATYIKGRLYVFPGTDTSNEIYVGDTASHKLLLTYNSSSTSGLIEITSLSGWHYVAYDGNGGITDGGLITDNTIPAMGAYYDFYLSGLKSGTTYTIMVEGYMSKESNTKTQIGTTTIKTLNE
jgi:hypothetical protein